MSSVPKGSWQELVAKKEEYASVKYNDPRLDQFANVVEQRYGLPKDLLVAIKNAGEKSNTGQVSPAGAKGVMQFIDSTRKTYQHDPSNPFASIDAAGRYFKDILERYNGDVKAAITEYNGGVRQAKRVQQGGEPTATETINYIKRIKAYMGARNRGT
jgi:soluble lytic murein transglycosylase-like protein